MFLAQFVNFANFHTLWCRLQSSDTKGLSLVLSVCPSACHTRVHVSSHIIFNIGICSFHAEEIYKKIRVKSCKKLRSITGTTCVSQTNFFNVVAVGAICFISPYLYIYKRRNFLPFLRGDGLSSLFTIICVYFQP